jgi:hypothetical protein
MRSLLLSGIVPRLLVAGVTIVLLWSAFALIAG